MFRSVISDLALVTALALGCAPSQQVDHQKSTRYDDLTALFTDWRTFQHPILKDGVPDYTAGAMTAQAHGLIAMKQRLGAIDPTGWPVSRQIDYQLVKAEMNGLDFDHRVLRPWAENPAYYVTVFNEQSDQPAREGPFAYGAVELWMYQFPLNDADEAKVATGIRAIPGLLAQAKSNLIGNRKDMWVFGAKSLQQQSGELAALGSKVGPKLAPDVERARVATDSLAAWVAAQAQRKTGPSGVGVENYNWFLKNVMLLPYTWEQEVALMRRELARAHASLALEERRNRSVPDLVPVASQEEHSRRFNAAVTEYMKFLRDHDVMTLKGYLEPALRARIGRFVPGPREFFTEVDYRDPEVMRTHGYHWFDLSQMANEPHSSPIRRGPLLYNMFTSRTEGFATAWEEMMMLDGMFDASPHSRELIYVLVGQRAARALGDLMMHANRFTIDEAAKFATANTPRGWLRANATTVWFEQFLYLQQPAYGTSYLIGKIEAEHLMMERRKQLGADYSMKRFMDEFNAVGLIPISMVEWELTGIRPELDQLGVP